MREQALKSAAQSQDFGQLFLGFSLFLVVAALLLMALLFQLGLEQRAAEVGILLALGLTPKQVRRLLLVEGAALALVGGVVGALGGIGLRQGDVVGSDHGVAQRDRGRGASIPCDRRQPVHRPLRQHRRGRADHLAHLAQTGAAACEGAACRRSPKSEVRSPKSRSVDCAGLGVGGSRDCRLGAGERARMRTRKRSLARAPCCWWRGLPRRPPGWARLARESGAARLTLGGLGVRGCARRRKRSLATIALLACGSFVIVAIGVFRLDANRDATRRDSGTGGFALIGESTMPVVQDLNTKAGT